MLVIIESTSINQVQAEINKAIQESTLAELITINNQLLPNHHVFVDKAGFIKSCHIKEIERWSESVNITFTTSDDTPEYPISYWIDDTPSDTSFSSEREALVYAFECNALNDTL